MNLLEAALAAYVQLNLAPGVCADLDAEERGFALPTPSWWRALRRNLRATEAWP